MMSLGSSFKGKSKDVQGKGKNAGHSGKGKGQGNEECTEQTSLGSMSGNRASPYQQ